MTVVDQVVELLADEEDEAIVYRKGRVEAIDKTGDLWKVEIAGRWMPYIDETIAVGDIVIYVDDFEDPFAWVEFEEAGNYTGFQISRRGGAWFVTGDGTGISAGTVYDYDQSFASFDPLDTIFLPPISRVHPVFGYESWTGGIVFYLYGAAVASTGAVDFLKTDISGDDLTPSAHSNWDGTLVPPLSDPVDEYTNLGGLLSLRSHGDIGLADLPGGHAHLVEPRDTAVDNLQSGEFAIIREAESIVSKNIATELTTVQAGVDLPWPVPLTAPGKDWLMLFIVHLKPLIGAPNTAPFAELELVEPDGSVYSIRSTVGAPRTDIGPNTGTMFCGWRSWEAGDYAPILRLDSGPDREFALSSFLIHSRTETV